MFVCGEWYLVLIDCGIGCVICKFVLWYDDGWFLKVVDMVVKKIDDEVGVVCW